MGTGVICTHAVFPTFRALSVYRMIVGMESGEDTSVVESTNAEKELEEEEQMSERRKAAEESKNKQKKRKGSQSKDRPCGDRSKAKKVRFDLMECHLL